jgi:hypothetical protein
MDKHYYLRPYSNVCKADGCEEQATQQVMRMANHVSIGEYCYGHAQIVVAQLEKSEQMYRDAVHQIINIGPQ